MFYFCESYHFRGTVPHEIQYYLFGTATVYYNVLKFLHKCINAICEQSKQIIVGIDSYNP
jgi:hypothetical protein